MDALPLALLILVVLAVGVGAGWFAGAARASERAGRDRGELAARAAAAETARDTLARQLDEQRALQRDLGLQARAEQAAREERERREQAVLRALAPVQESLSSMQHKVEQLERERQQQYGSLAEQLRRAQESDEALRSTTESLAGALRSNATRGVWGETQLRRIVESAGLTRYVDFDLQSSVSSDAGAGRPDMIIRLPGGKALALDAKVPLDSYLEATAIPETAQGEEGARRQALLDRHVKAVRAHVDALSKKAYWAGLDASPEFVICFVPSESLLSAALAQDPALLDHAFGKRVALASPVNLWAVLKTVAYTWTQQDVSEEARELLALGTQLYERLGSLTGHADDMRRAIERTVESYNKLVGSLESRVLVTARRFPGIDETKLDVVAAPAVIESTPRRLTAPEFDQAEPALIADVGEVRDRVAED
ncbi:DNA recombination protein RmuC [Microbacterium sp. zg.Y1090]|uniref:DNA recombination protein RmuC n=1 Tax=Microbacterium TaxID=33882 RepID=UPI00214B3A20|nr:MULTISPECIES: DNA recombination protein RmuC [unclassified Microbacterium]MCR2812146.1 DNA recombination protein RmuC [Microbacterium sp. zg.Y1084]MCR2818416.1 DNA recombination protein RmuC [Microbacterium sp. zg.Y1090]WIM29427.1 DNA recombination protein RmuC [Microbacterium sp. zg-Y1090]